MAGSISDLRVTVSVNGRFHAFELASQLAERGYLRRLITAYPRSVALRRGAPKSNVVSLGPFYVFSRAFGTVHMAGRQWSLWPQLNEAFDRVSWRLIPEDTNLYVGWSGCAERGILRARELGAVTVLERGSSHIEVQRRLLEEEYARWGARPDHIPAARTVAKELREYDLAQYIAVPSSFNRRTFVEQGVPEEKIITIPYGIDVSGFSPAPSPPDVFRVLYAGTMSLRKGVHYLLEAFAGLTLPGAELWLVGAVLPEIEPFFARYEGTFRYFPPVPRPELARYYQASSMFAMCSIEEGMAQVQFQALASGLPLLCTTNTGGDDLISDGVEGFVVPIRDVDALREKIDYLYRHPEERRAMGRAGAERVRDRFSPHRYGEAIAQEYRRIVERR